ncbi:MAG: ydaF 1 [Bacteroidetes bacterium]|jgi:RimJ/RimL family protein N-acetyltransferase|nr:ydaF 1 [Bacteroidota bacterium]
MNWIKQSTTLTGEAVILIPLCQDHFEALALLAKDERIWGFIPVDMSETSKCINSFESALIERNKGTQFPFVIFHRKDNKIIGSTRLMEMYPLHRKLEIGWTWLHPDYWTTEVNLECKLLLLSFCFEKLNAIRVQLKTDENNIRSKRAIEKIGGKYEGTLRNDMLRADGTFRNSAYFSIISSEWDRTKSNLNKLFENKTNVL